MLGGYKLGTGCLPTFSGAPAMHTMTFGQGWLTSCWKGMGAVWALGGAAKSKAALRPSSGSSADTLIGLGTTAAMSLLARAAPARRGRLAALGGQHTGAAPCCQQC